MQLTQTQTETETPSPDGATDTRLRDAGRRRWLLRVALVLITTIMGLAIGGAWTTPAAPAVSAVDATAASYGAPGPHTVGITTLDPIDGLPELTHWYPATASTDGEPVSYDQRLLVGGPLSGLAVGFVDGTAVPGAPALDGPPRPLVVIAPGYGVVASSYGWLAEHLASYGFSVVVHEAEETLASAMGDGLWQSAADRPAVLAATVTRLRDRAHAGLAAWDPDRVAVLGHSIGGHAALAVGGARLDTDAFAARCAAGDEDAAWLCDVLVDSLDAIATRAGVAGDAMPLLVDDTDVDAVVSLAGDAYLFDADGLAAMTTPVLAVGGLADTGTPWDLGAGMTATHASSEHRIAVGLDGAEHLVFTGRCDRLRRVTPLVPMDLCDDPDGDRTTRHDVIAHVTTAFLLDTLTDDTSAAAALTAPAPLPATTVTTHGATPDES